MATFATLPGWMSGARRKAPGVEGLDTARHGLSDASFWRTVIGATPQDRATAAATFGKSIFAALVMLICVIAAQKFMVPHLVTVEHALGFGAIALALGLMIGILSLFQQRLAERTELLGVVADVPYGFTLMHRLDGGLVYASPSCERITGFTPREFFANPMRAEEMVHPEDRPLWERYRDDIAQGARPSPILVRLSGRDGKEIWVRHARELVQNDYGAVIGLRSTHVDVSDRVAMELALVDSHEQARAAEQAKARFLANMNLEMRTPLNSIIGFSDIMANEIFGPLGKPEYAEYAKDINAAGRQMLARVDEVLDLSRLESGAVKLRESAVNVGLTVASCRRLMADEAKAQGVALETDAPDTLPQLFADQQRVRDMLLKLLSNAVKFTPPGGTVTCKAEVGRDGCFVMSIADTGIGIPDDAMTLAMADFEQGNGPVDTKRYAGIGLGLPLARRMATLHGADLAIDSRPNQGSTVKVRFPASRTLRS